MHNYSKIKIWMDTALTKKNKKLSVYTVYICLLLEMKTKKQELCIWI